MSSMKEVQIGGGTDDKGREYSVEIVDLGYCIETVTKVVAPDGRVDIYIDKESKEESEDESED